MRTVNQQRGLRQGDSLSPILFNLALEPLLMTINQDDSIIGHKYETPTQVQSIKLLAYADDICTVLQLKEDYDKLQVHLDSYSSVSNAKFNQDKTEAFSLSGKMDQTRKVTLLVDNINKYYINQSPVPFWYLGFYMVSTTVHRQWLQTRLLQTIRSTAMSYPSRKISLRGRVTVMNTLIMTKIWYCLRLFQPTQGFLNQLQSTIYQFVWLNKRPLVSFAQLSLPRHQGGLGVLSPHKHFMSLQIRHLRHVFFSSPPSVLVKPLMDYHLQLINPGSSLLTLSFFIPSLRRHELNHPTSILHAMYKAFDHFKYQPDISSLSLKNLLLLPLSYFFQSIPACHWLLKHPYFPANKFFCYDPILQRLRPKVLGEYDYKPGLCRILYRHLLVERTIQLQPFVWNFILQTVDSAEFEKSDTTVTDAFKAMDSWKYFNPAEYRNLNDEQLRKAALLIHAVELATFWETPMLLQARALWYRTLSKKLPITKFLHTIKTVSSSQCRLCNGAEDNLSHFMINCPIKQEIWSIIIPKYFPDLIITIPDILTTLLSLESPVPIRKRQRPKYFTILSTTHWTIWIYYWEHIINQTPFILDTIVNKITSHISILLDKPTNF